MAGGIMTILSVVYASAPTDEVIIPTLEIQIPNGEPIRICSGFEDQVLGVDGVYHLFEAGSLSIALPKKDTSGQQTLTFGVANVSGIAQSYIDESLESGEQVPLIFREYLVSDKSAPARRPYTMVLVGGRLEGGEAQFEGSYQDLLNQAWPRERYTAQNAPGIKYL
jgi:hypothetical protein